MPRKDPLNRQALTKLAREQALPLYGIDTKLVECLEAFEAWLAAEPWHYQYESAKAGFMAAWFRNERS